MYIGVDIGGTKILVAGANLEGKAVSQQKIPTPAKTEIGMEAIIDLVHAAARQKDIKAIGVAAPGPIDWASGAIGSTPNLKWKHTPIVSRLEHHFRTKVILENDTNAAALAEARLGAGKGFNSVLYVGIGTGIGTGVVVGGKVYRGAFDTEGGHIVINPNGEVCGCGGRGHWETLVSGPAFLKRFGKMPTEIKSAAVWDDYAKDLAQGLATLTAALSPAVIVIGGGLGTHFESFRKPLTKHLAEMYQIYPQPKILAAKFPETASVFGAIIAAREA